MSQKTDAPSGARIGALPFAPLSATPAVVPQPYPAPAPVASETAVYDEQDRLVMLTPCYGGQQTVIFRDSVHVALSQGPRANFRCADGKVRNMPILAMALNLPGDSHIDRARNNIIHDGLKTPYRHFLFCDGDQPFEMQDIALTWAHLMSGVRVIGGTVALKVLKATFACNTIEDIRTLDKDGLLPGRDTGTGWLGFRRDVLDEIRVRWPKFVRERIAWAIGDVQHDEIHHDGPTVSAVVQVLAECGLSADLGYIANPNSPHAGETVSAYFASGVAYRDGALDWLSEDWMFCLRCRLLGIPIKIDPMIRVKHLGPMLFPPDPATLVEAALHAVSGKNPPFDPQLAAAAHDALKALHEDIADVSISVLHPTRRGAQALARWEQWVSRCAGRPFEHIFAVDEGDSVTLETLAGSGFEPVIVPGGRGVVAAINAAAAGAKGRILVMAADDCEPPEGWDLAIRAELAGQLHLPRVLWVSDGYSDQPVITHPIMTRAFYREQGWFFCPEYPHLFCDTELTVRALAAKQVIDARHLVFRHHHPMFTGEAPDALHAERNSPAARNEGLAIFKRRNPGARHPHAP